MFTYDPDSYNSNSPKEIVPYIMELLKPSSVLDVGCGNGIWLNEFKKYVDRVVGVDLDNKIVNFPYVKCDLNKPFDIGEKFDLVVSVEVAEHLKKESADLFIKSLTTHSDVVIFSAAIPNQSGQGHLNEQYPDYWREKFSQRAFKCYDVFRSKFWNNPKVNFWYKQNMFLYARDLDLVPSENILSFIHPDLFDKKTNLKFRELLSLMLRPIKKRLRL